MSLVVAPSYLETHGPLVDARELINHECILTFDNNWKPQRGWPLTTGEQTEVTGKLVSHDIVVRLTAALAGYGIALMPDALTNAYVATGQLVRILQDQVQDNLPMSLVFTDRKFMPTQVRAFIDFTVAFYHAARYDSGQRTPPWLLPPTVKPNASTPED